MRTLLLLLPVLFACAPSADAQNFRLPIDCSIGADCIVQNYADADPAPGVAEDPQCGPLTYDGHDGIDFRAPAAMAARGVSVLAPAAGVVAAVRDGEADGAFARGGAAAIAGRDCGNGVRIDHEGGWSSQLCHMRNGSVRVREGERVTAGQTVGLVGLSGHTQFPHVHLTLRRGGEEVEPVTGGALGAQRCGGRFVPGNHWAPEARASLSYRGAQWFAMGFTGVAPANESDAETLPANASRQAPALVFWALATAPLNGDVLRVRLYGPDGALVAEGERTQPRDQAQAWLFAGQRTPAGGWPAGTYRGEAQLLRGGRVVTVRTASVSLR
jgi:murein DD-endopeptidase MepM/ murein hydrolase activator NlpD